LDDLLNLIGGKHAPLATVMMIVGDGGRGQRRRGRQHSTSGGPAAKRQDTTTADGHAEIKMGHGRLLSKAMNETRPTAGRA
jgi:hypothetical protein